MADQLTIGDVRPRVQYTADGTQTVFTYPFPIFEATDLDVYLDTDRQETGYTVVGAGQSAGGTVTFDLAPTSGVVITLRRLLAIARVTDFQEAGEFRASVLNDELDRLTAALQQVDERADRAVTLPVTSSLVSVGLPTPEAGKSVAWNTDATALINGPSVDDILAVTPTAEAVQANAVVVADNLAATQATAAAAADSASAAATSADAAAASEQVAAGHVDVAAHLANSAGLHIYLKRAGF